MVITYLGKDFVRINSGERALALSPAASDGGRRIGSFGADIALAPVRDKDHAAFDHVTHGKTEPFTIYGPGEYEVGGISIIGVASDRVCSLDDRERVNTAYVIGLEGIRLCHMGAHRKADFPAGVSEALGAVDVLFISIGGEAGLDHAGAQKIVAALEPKMIIPLRASGENGEKEFKAFLKESGEGNTPTVGKLVLKKKDLEGKDGELVVLECAVEG